MRILLVADAHPGDPEITPAARSFALAATWAGLAVEVPDPSWPLGAELARLAPGLVAAIGGGPLARAGETWCQLSVCSRSRPSGPPT